MFDVELEKFKGIDLSWFLERYYGFKLDKEKTSKNQPVLELDGDKLILRYAQDGHWTYFNANDDRDRGSIIDFIQKREGGTLGKVRKHLRNLLGISSSLLSKEIINKNINDDVLMNRTRAVEEETKFSKELLFSYYLESRGITKETYLDKRFRGKIRYQSKYNFKGKIIDISKRGNILFSHVNNKGQITGYEKKNEGFSRFTVFGEKNIWISNEFSDDRGLVLSESAIDALSYFQLYDKGGCRYASLCGNWSSKTTADIIKFAVNQLPDDSKIILVYDNDKDGKRYAELTQKLLKGQNYEVMVHSPKEGKDWNEVLMSQKKPGLVQCYEKKSNELPYSGTA